MHGVARDVTTLIRKHLPAAHQNHKAYESDIQRRPNMPLPKGEYLTYEQQCAHREAVAAVSKRLQHFYALKKPYRVYHGSTNSTKHSNKTVDNVVDTSGLSQVLGKFDHHQSKYMMELYEYA